MKKRKLFLHIGAHKTGTTALQTFFKDNQRVLEENGLVYPNSGLLDIGHHALVQCLIDEEIFWIKLDKPKEELLQDFQEEINGINSDVLLSAENFLRVEPNRLGFLKDSFDVKVVIFLRRQDELINSHYNQVLKAKYETSEIGSFLDNRKLIESLKFDKVLDEWADVFGTDNIIVKVYEKEQMTNGLFNTFFESINRQLPEKAVFPEGRINPSMGVSSLEMLRLCNSSNEIEQKHIFVQFLREALDPSGSGKAPNLLSAIEIEKISKIYLESNEKVAKKYLNRDSGKLFMAEYPSGKEQIDYHLLSNNNAAIIVDLWNRLHRVQDELDSLKSKTYPVSYGLKQALKNKVKALIKFKR